ncbi:phospholipase A [Oryzomicrobium sp.]|uniref:phospholipase A n=1 Tax=Oryzomicrobium sp. TaxID=1911578 RepID=UPI0025EDCD79|nr:phospholipase A [Oryzomicrobium sp.]MCE1241928.1 phospholipase A [Oryzomicrobium sp.]
MSFRAFHALAASLLALNLVPARAQAPLPGAPGSLVSGPGACVGIASPLERLACYDRSLGRRSATEPAPGEQPAAGSETGQPLAHVPPGAPAPASALAEQLPAANAAGGLRAVPGGGLVSDAILSAEVTPFDDRWELTPAAKRGTWVIRPYKPVYLLPVFYTRTPNREPTSPNPANQVHSPLPFDSTEAKFQLSLKTKAWENIFGDNGDLWLGYTQSSRWQVYNGGISRPFRETNYEPEAMLVFRTNYSLLGWNGRLASISFNHQSNGRADPLSRSWNRVIGSLGFEKGDWNVMLRGWYRVPEKAETNDNPDISDYMGRGDLLVVRRWGGHVFSLGLRHSLRTGERNHGSAEFDWGFPISGNLRGHVQVFSGYGESMIDYNYRATYYGLGISLVEW